MPVLDRLPRCLALILFSTLLDATAAVAAPAPSQGPWQDLGHGILLQPSTGLRWTRSDNGQDIDWADAKSYCARLGSGWHLPTVDQLVSVHVAAEQAGERTACGKAICTAPSQFQLSSPWLWSSAAVTREQAADFDELAWGVTLVNGRKSMGLRFLSDGARVLCVQNP
jgi:hypothetical protein